MILRTRSGSGNKATSSGADYRAHATATPTSTKYYEDPDISVLGESMMSLNVDFLEDPVPPPELTRPEPLRSGSGTASTSANATLPHVSSASSAACGTGGPAASANAALDRSPMRRGRPVSLNSIMHEQQRQQHVQQQQQQQVQLQQQQLDRHHRDREGGVDLEDLQAQEEALVQLALERSLRSLGENKSVHSYKSHHSSSRSLSEREADFAREVQMEADRTELAVVEGPHTSASAALALSSSRPSLSRVHSRDSEDGLPIRSLSRSNSALSGRSGSSSSASASPGRGFVRSACNSPAFGVAAAGSRPGHLPRQLSRRGGLRRSTSQSASTLVSGSHGAAPHSPHPHSIVAGSHHYPSLSAASSPASAASSSPAQQPNPRSRSGGPRRQASIRIGPLPSNILGEDGLIDGAEAVLEVARQNLSPTEVEMIERALRKRSRGNGSGGGGGIRSVPAGGGATPPAAGAEDPLPVPAPHEGNGPGLPSAEISDAVPFPNQPPQHHLSPDEMEQIERALRESAEDGSQATDQRNRSDYIDGGPPMSPLRRQPPSPSSRSVGLASSPREALAASSLSEAYDFRGAEANLSEEELRQIHQALLETNEEVPEETPAVAVASAAAMPAAAAAAASPLNPHLSEADAAAIAQALRDAEEEEEMRNFRLALQMQQQEDDRLRGSAAGRQRQPQGNVRTMTRAELEAEQRLGAVAACGPPLLHHPLDHLHPAEADAAPAAGFRMNSNARHEWIRRDQNSIRGPNDEVRTKHDPTLDGLAHAHRLGLDGEDDDGGVPHVGHTAYNSFMQSVRRHHQQKGVVSHGTGRAGGSDADATRGGALDANARLQISRAVNLGWIEQCNGVVQEGKEAVVYHADRGEESGGFDVAVKVFKRIQDFKGRGDYVDGDPRYAHENFRRLGPREQLEVWTEKEFRNLTRALRGGVPVPSPLFHKENVLFMRFLGTDGWPAPQLRDLNLRPGSSKWMVLYSQVLGAIRKYVAKWAGDAFCAAVLF